MGGRELRWFPFPFQECLFQEKDIMKKEKIPFQYISEELMVLQACSSLENEALALYLMLF